MKSTRIERGQNNVCEIGGLAEAVHTLFNNLFDAQLLSAAQLKPHIALDDYPIVRKTKPANVAVLNGEGNVF
jgi:hypothetical protein